MAYQKLLNKEGVLAEILDFKELPESLAFSETFGKRTPQFEALVQSYVRPFQKIIFIVPEYNGSFPGILKSFLDSVHPSEWRDKKACLVGVSDGRAGNLRGMDHLTGVLHYLKMHVFYDKLPISSVSKVINEAFQFSQEQQSVCSRQLQSFMQF
jgi:NAD(P)H-dependent FMN reductase